MIHVLVLVDQIVLVALGLNAKQAVMAVKVYQLRQMIQCDIYIRVVIVCIQLVLNETLDVIAHGITRQLTNSFIGIAIIHSRMRAGRSELEVGQAF